VVGLKKMLGRKGLKPSRSEKNEDKVRQRQKTEEHNEIMNM
jgi:hypothetical protein